MQGNSVMMETLDSSEIDEIAGEEISNGDPMTFDEIRKVGKSPVNAEGSGGGFECAEGFHRFVPTHTS